MAQVTDIRVATSFFGHPKAIKLQRRLGDAAIVSLIRLWCWVGENKPAGVLAGMDREDIEIASGWCGEPGALISALTELRLLDFDEKTASYAVHDWADHNGWAVLAQDRSDRSRYAGWCRQLGKERADELLAEVKKKQPVAEHPAEPVGQPVAEHPAEPAAEPPAQQDAQQDAQPLTLPLLSFPHPTSPHLVGGGEDWREAAKKLTRIARAKNMIQTTDAAYQRGIMRTFQANGGPTPEDLADIETWEEQQLAAGRKKEYEAEQRRAQAAEERREKERSMLITATFQTLTADEKERKIREFIDRQPANLRPLIDLGSPIWLTSFMKWLGERLEIAA